MSADHSHDGEVPWVPDGASWGFLSAGAAASGADPTGAGGGAAAAGAAGGAAGGGAAGAAGGGAAGAAGGTAAGAAGGGRVWPGRGAQERVGLRVCDPVMQGLLDAVRVAVEALAGALAGGEVDAADALGVAGQVFTVEQQLRGVHDAAVGMADQGGWWGIAGYTSTAGWLRHTHLLGGRAANRVGHTARWLTGQPVVAAALGAGEICQDHVQVMRTVATSSPARSVQRGGWGVCAGRTQRGCGVPGAGDAFLG